MAKRKRASSKWAVGRRSDLAGRHADEQIGVSVRLSSCYDGIASAGGYGHGQAQSRLDANYGAARGT
jgi:hypothetical protein